MYVYIYIYYMRVYLSIYIYIDQVSHILKLSQEVGELLVTANDALVALVRHVLRKDHHQCSCLAARLLVTYCFDHERVMSQLIETLGASHSRIDGGGELPAGLYKILFYFEAFVHESTIRIPPPTCKAYPIAIRLHDHCAIYVPPLRPPFSKPHTIQCWS